MLRVTALIAIVAALPASALAARRADAPAPVVARVASCDIGTSERSAAFYARMDSRPGADRMQIRFQLMERLGRGAPWTRLDVPGLRDWHSAQPGVRRFGWKQTVTALHVGGAYRAHVQYRWLSAAGAVLATDFRDTGVCRGPLPNIELGSLTVGAGPAADTRVYRIPVRNGGRITAPDVEVALTVDRAVLDSVTVRRLAPGESRTVSFTGPACRSAVRVTADPANTIGELAEGDNSQLFACPA